MSCKVMYTCDHCGKEVSPDIGKQWKAGFLTVGPNIEDIHACSFEHLTLALAKTFYIPLDASTLRLVTEKNDALNAARAAIVECDNMRARLAELEARMPANEVTNAERAQYEAMIELQRKRIEELQANADGLERDRRHCVEAISESNLVPPGRTLVEGIGELVRLHRHAAKKIAELEKCILRPVSVDGKTPGEVALEAWNPGANGYSAYRDDWERAALAVLRAFGQPSQTQQDTAKVLRKVRDRIESSGAAMFQDEKASMDAIEHAASIIDEELEAKPTSETPACFLCGKGPHEHTMMTLESLPEEFEVTWCNGRRQNFGTEKPAWWDAPKSDHVHELKSRSFCDKQAPTPAQAQKRFKYDRAWLSEQTDDALFDLYMDHVGFFDMNGTMLQRENMIETLAALEQEQAITLPTKPTKPLREGDR